MKDKRLKGMGYWMEFTFIFYLYPLPFSTGSTK